MTTIYTLGHSRHSAEHFTALIHAQAITRLVDVRSHPVSKWAPQFAKAALARQLESQGIEYVFLGRELGGRPAAPACYATDGRLDYTLRAQMPDFESGITRLLALARERPTTILCAEENPACCHRRLLVTPALQRAGLHVVHLRGDGRLEADVDTPTQQLALFR